MKFKVGDLVTINHPTEDEDKGKIATITRIITDGDFGKPYAAVGGPALTTWFYIYLHHLLPATAPSLEDVL